METIVSQKMSRGQGNELLNKLEAAGCDGELAQKVIDSKGNDLAAEIVELIRGRGFKSSTYHTQARAIMGRNFFGIEEAIKYFEVNPPEHQIAYLAEVPFTEEVLRACKDTHVLVAVFPLSIIDIRDIAKKQSDQTLFNSQDWYEKQAFARDNGVVSWQLVRKAPIANSTSKTWDEQQALLGNDEETPTARIMIYTMVGRFLATGKRLFEKIYVRCCDFDSDGYRVRVGDFGAEGLHVDGWHDDYRGSALGVSAGRKF